MSSSVTPGLNAEQALSVNRDRGVELVRVDLVELHLGAGGESLSVPGSGPHREPDALHVFQCGPEVHFGRMPRTLEVIFPRGGPFLAPGLVVDFRLPEVAVGAGFPGMVDNVVDVRSLGEAVGQGDREVTARRVVPGGVVEGLVTSVEGFLYVLTLLPRGGGSGQHLDPDVILDVRLADRNIFPLRNKRRNFRSVRRLLLPAGEREEEANHVHYDSERFHSASGSTTFTCHSRNSDIVKNTSPELTAFTTILMWSKGCVTGRFGDV